MATLPHCSKTDPLDDKMDHSPHGFSLAEDDILIKLREKHKLGWVKLAVRYAKGDHVHTPRDEETLKRRYMDVLRWRQGGPGKYMKNWGTANTNKNTNGAKGKIVDDGNDEEGLASKRTKQSIELADNDDDEGDVADDDDYVENTEGPLARGESNIPRGIRFFQGEQKTSTAIAPSRIDDQNITRQSSLRSTFRPTNSPSHYSIQPASGPTSAQTIHPSMASSGNVVLLPASPPKLAGHQAEGTGQNPPPFATSPSSFNKPTYRTTMNPVNANMAANDVGPKAPPAKKTEAKQTCKLPVAIFKTAPGIENAADLRGDFADFGFSPNKVRELMNTREAKWDGTAQRPNQETIQQREAEKLKASGSKRKARGGGGGSEPYQHLRLGDDESNWVLYNPIKGVPPQLGPMPSFLVTWASFKPDNKRILEYNIVNESVRTKSTPEGLRGKTVEYTPFGPRIVEEMEVANVDGKKRATIRSSELAAEGKWKAQLAAGLESPEEEMVDSGNSSGLGDMESSDVDMNGQVMIEDSQEIA